MHLIQYHINEWASTSPLIFIYYLHDSVACNWWLLHTNFICVFFDFLLVYIWCQWVHVFSWNCELCHSLLYVDLHVVSLRSIFMELWIMLFSTSCKFTCRVFESKYFCGIVNYVVSYLMRIYMCNFFFFFADFYFC